ncbi:odorant receptor 9a [Monomorium pharaonis]|uniref:odorant receptor 9a n=1 Tax=Monomorium pharaonis TaxID=307658 RepID=UPI00102E1E5D|nr:odorant receptor 9a [Monomorium pharaonis]
MHNFIQEDWKIMRNKLENDIIENHAHDFRNYTILIFRCTGIIMVILGIIQFFPVILDFVSPLDKSRPRKLLIEVEYFIIQDNHFYTVVLHATIIFAIYASIILATGTQLLLFSYHSFGMFKIASHRIQNFVDDHFIHMPNYKKKRAIYKRVIHVVIAHRRAIEFANILTSSFNILYCVLAILGVFSLSINLFRFIQAITVTRSVEEVLICFFIILGHLIYMFLANYVGQKATDCNNEIFKLTYGTSWYLMPVTSQKLILFLMTRIGKEFYYSIGFIFVAKIENFSMLVNTALSYVAVMYSVQQK